jgi:hypothetical protein
MPQKENFCSSSLEATALTSGAMRVSSLVAAPLVLVVGGLVAALAGTGGCSSSSGGSSPAVDASEDYSVPPVEAGGDDGPALYDVDAGPPVVFPRVYVVNASPDAPPLRFCLGFGAPGEGGAVVVGGGLSASPDQAMAGFALPGLYPGYGMPLDDHGVDLDTLTVSVFALDATSATVAANTADGGIDAAIEAPCEALIGNDGLGAASDAGGLLRPGRDFWNLGTLPMGVLAHGTTWLAAVTGCVPGETNAAALCPAGYDANAGDLQLMTWPLDTTTQVAAGSIGAQLVQASSEWDNFARAAGGVTSAGFLAASGDAGTALPIATDAGFGALQPATLAQVPGVAFDGTASFYAQITGADGGAVAPTPLGWPLPAVQAMSWPGAAPDAGVLRDGAGFVFVLVGNPAPATPDAGVTDGGHAAHVLAFPVSNP